MKKRGKDGEISVDPSCVALRRSLETVGEQGVVFSTIVGCRGCRMTIMGGKILQLELLRDGNCSRRREGV